VDEPPRLTAEEVANGCAAYVACDDESALFRTQGSRLGACASGRWWFPAAREETIPRGNERFPFFIREILAARGDCAAIRSILTDAPLWLSCTEYGCAAWVQHEVSCEGDVAVFDDGTRRDCSRAYATCSTSSETGCTDRPVTRCETGAQAKCDGDVRLGCGACGFVSFHDCGWGGGHCEETDEGAECVEPDASTCEGVQNGCTDGVFERCVLGQRVRVDCAAIGMECATEISGASPPQPSDACAAEGLSSPCALRYCRARPDSPDGGTIPEIEAGAP
jgi:hypothetical protein